MGTEAGRLLRYARRRSGLTQRALADKAGVAQSVIARIETGKVDPQVSTLSRLLRAAEMTLEAYPGSGQGVDRTLIYEALKLSPTERLRHASEAAAAVQRFREALAAS